MSFLTEHYDPALVVDTTLTAAVLTTEETARLVRDYAVMSAVGAIPRRLGSDASPEELSEDKKHARRAAHVFEQCHKDWSGKKLGRLPNEGAIAQEAAALAWNAWWGSKQIYLLGRIRYIVTWCDQSGSHPKTLRWTKSAVVRLQNEQRWLEYALR